MLKKLPLLGDSLVNLSNANFAMKFFIYGFAIVVW